MSIRPKKAEPHPEDTHARRRAHEDLARATAELIRIIHRYSPDKGVAAEAGLSITSIVQEVAKIVS